MFPQGAVSRDLQLETSTFKYVNSREKKKKPKATLDLLDNVSYQSKQPKAHGGQGVPSIPTMGEAKLQPDLGDPAAAHISQNAAQLLFLTFPSTSAQGMPPFVVAHSSKPVQGQSSSVNAPAMEGILWAGS